MASDTCGDETTQDDNTCPVCGQEYVHKRKESEVSNHVLRDDYAQCRVEASLSSQQDTVFVHKKPTRITQKTVETSRGGALSTIYPKPSTSWFEDKETGGGL